MSQQRKVALITGASRGIGRGCAIHLAKRGLDVVLCARTVKKGQAFEHSSTVKKSDTRSLPGSLEETAAELEAHGVKVLSIKMDLLEKADLEQAVEQTLHAFGRVDVLVNNGRYIGPGHMDLLMDTPIDILEKHVMANTIAPIYLTKLVVPAMIEQGGGVVINLTSGSGQHETAALPGEGGWGLGYSISKAGFNRAGPGMAKELRQHNISIINLEPGFVATERMAFDMGAFGFDVNAGLSVDVPGAVCAFLATCPHPMFFSGKQVDAPEFAVAHGLVDPATLPRSHAPSNWGLPRG